MSTFRFPPDPPNDNHWSWAPISDWQSRLREELLVPLDRQGWSIRGASRIYYCDYMVQVYVDNWTFHFQVGTYGKEFKSKEKPYGNLAGKALLAFDVESAGRGTNVKRLREEIHKALASAGVYERLGSENEMIEEHVVWEAIDAYDTELAAQRIAEYMDAIFDIAWPILERLNGV